MSHTRSLLFSYLPLVLGLVALVVGAFGFHQVSSETSFTTCLYQAAQLFALNSGAIQGPVPWMLEAARWLAPIATFGAIMIAIQNLFQSFFTTIKVNFFRGHTIICGAGERGFSIATRMHRKGDKVVVIDAKKDNPNLSHLSFMGIPFFVGDGLDEAVLARAGKIHAERIIGISGSDETNLKIAGNLAGRFRGEILIAVEKPELRTLFRDQIGFGRDKKSVRVLGFHFRAAKKLFFEIAKNLCVQTGKVREGAHVYCEVKGDYLEDFLRAATLMLQISGEIRPKISIYSFTPGFKQQFLLRYPLASLVADLIWLEDCPTRSARPSRFDAAVFCLGEDMLSLERADLFNILSLCPRQHIYAALEKSSNATFLSKTGFGSANSFQIVDLVDFSFGDDDPLDDHVEQQARCLHQDYVQKEISKDPSWARLPLDWSYLDEGYRESNRLQAAHLQIKRLTWDSFPREEKDFCLDKLARAEHLRWMADKVMHGWRWSGSMSPSSRDDRKRIHHLLVPFESLSEEEKNKDRDPIRKYLESSAL